MNCLHCQQKPLIIIGGATGVGKTELSIRLAKSVNGSIISADSMQIFKGFDIGSAKIRPEEMQGVKHYLIDILEPDEEFNVFEFRKMALNAMEEIYGRGEIPIIVGGTGFYIQSVLYDIQFSEESPDEEYRAQLWEKADIHGAGWLHDKLREVDPDAADAICANNIKRVIRALEFYKETGIKISVHNKEQRERISPYNFAYFVLNRPRETVYDRINKRVDIMISEGLEDEVRKLLTLGVSRKCQAMKGLGYKEMCEYLLPSCHPETISHTGTNGHSERSEESFRMSSKASEATSSTETVSSRANEASSSTKTMSSRASEATSSTKTVSSRASEASSSTKTMSSRANEATSSTETVSSRANEATSSTETVSSRASEASRGILYTTLNECANAIKQNTRHFAKRQITWFKREKDAIWVELEKYENTDEVLKYMTDILKEKKIV